MIEALVLGARGMLGRALVSILGDRCMGVGRDQCDITDPSAVRAWIRNLHPSCVINCAAYTRVDDAERERGLAMRVNGYAPGNAARVAREEGSGFFHISTDYVFDGSGKKPWREDDPPCPVNFYGLSKLEGERGVQKAGGRWCITRTQWLFGAGGANFVDTIRRLSKEKEEIRVVSDQIGAPTFTMDMARAIALMAERGAEGIFHLANSDYASWYEVALHVARRINPRCRVVPCATGEMPRPARRPANSRLDCSKAREELGIALRHWTEAVDEYLGV
jgi:dTDP-4-dehydrorhamnose reductase